MNELVGEIYLVHNSKLPEDSKEVACHICTIVLALHMSESNRMTMLLPVSIFILNIVVCCNGQIANEVQIGPHISCVAYTRNCHL